MQTGNRIEISWVNQPGRLISSMESIADGFHGSSAIAGAVSVAENSSPGSLYAQKAVAIVRDAFAEGVAYGVENVFKEAIDEINAFAGEGVRDPLSLAAAAVLGDEVWVYSMGTCQVFLSGVQTGGRDSEGVVNVEGRVIKHYILKPGQSIILLTSGLRKLMGSAVAGKHSARCSRPLSFCLSEMINETRIKFRKKGGSAAAVRLCTRSRRMSLPGRKYLAYITALIIAVAVTLLTLCRSSGENGSPVRADSIPEDEIVMPLD
ncbi:hypothetical protein DRQ25_05510 [Candidatus Fermentibacteria bacterium]|nr:MAG: hypothetical protein DRQ25_05510 [Candidatus Fermentibacteria bacterium]